MNTSRTIYRLPDPPNKPEPQPVIVPVKDDTEERGDQPKIETK